jgi:hypothetical protein
MKTDFREQFDLLFEVSSSGVFDFKCMEFFLRLAFYEGWVYRFQFARFDANLEARRSDFQYDENESITGPKSRLRRQIQNRPIHNDARHNRFLLWYEK